jgi:hypothetical protein
VQHRVLRPFIALLTCSTWLGGCSSCEPDSPRATASATASAASAAPSVAPGPPEPPPRRNLPARSSIDEKLLDKRQDLLDRLEDARKLEDPVARLSALKELLMVDTGGSVVSLAASRAFLENGDPEEAARTARRAVYGAVRRPGLLADARAALGAALEKSGNSSAAHIAYSRALDENKQHKEAAAGLERVKLAVDASTPPLGAGQATWERIAGVDEACRMLKGVVLGGKVPLLSSTPKTLDKLDCAIDGGLVIGNPALDRAYAFRLDAAGVGTDRLLWIGLETSTGFFVYGPVARALIPDVAGATNDVIADLQQIQVLPGGAPEVVVKIGELRTVPDLALGEVLELDETRALLVTVDDKQRASKAVVLSTSSVRKALGPKPAKLPHGIPRVALGKVEGYQMKVAWSGRNAMTLTKASGNQKPEQEGLIELFE